MEVMRTAEEIRAHFMTGDSENVAKYYCGEENAHHILECKVLSVVDFKEDSMCSQILWCRTLKETLTVEDMKDFFYDADVMSNIQVDALDDIRERWVVYIHHSY